MSPGKKRVTEKKQKTKTFTSCWTCRARKVKCDGIRPSCGRCGKACLLCEGFAMRLYWITGEEGVPPSAIKRQAMSLEGYPQWSFPLEAIDEHLAKLDKYDLDISPRESCSAGPFSVFNSQSHKQFYAEEDAISQWSAFTYSNFQQAFDSATPGLYLDRHSSFDKTHDLFVDDGDEEDEEEDQSQYELMALDKHLSDQSRHLVETWSQQSSSPILLELNTSVYQNTLASQLMDNYIHHVANLLQPITHPQNTYSSIYVPRAMLGLAKFMKGTPQSTSKIQATNDAIFYSLLATSAFHLRGINVDGRLDGLARNFRAKAFQNLQKAMQELPVSNELRRSSSQSTVRRYEATMSAMLTLVTADIMDGDMNEYWVHLEGVHQIRRDLQSLNGQQPLSSHARRLFTISSFLNILSDSTTVTLPSIHWSETTIFPDTGRDFFSDGGYGLEFTYGITSTLANLLHQTTILSQHFSYFASRSLPIPQSLLSKSIDFSTTLSAWSIDDEALSTLNSDAETGSTSNPNLIVLAKLHILAFATSLRIYYHTRVLPCHSSTEMSRLVQGVAEHLTHIEDIKAAHKANHGAKLTASIMWPGFIASCEAESGRPREVWYRWWQTMLQYQIGNIAHLWMVVEEAWALRDAGLREVPAWMAVLRRTRKRVLAV